MEIPNLPAGTYAIDLTKDGYTPIKFISYKFIGNGVDFSGHLQVVRNSKTTSAACYQSLWRFLQAYYRDSLYTYSNGDTVTLAYIPDSILSPSDGSF